MGLFSKYLEKRPIHIFLIATFQFFQITIIYKGTQVTNYWLLNITKYLLDITTMIRYRSKTNRSANIYIYIYIYILLLSFVFVFVFPPLCPLIMCPLTPHRSWFPLEIIPKAPEVQQPNLLLPGDERQPAPQQGKVAHPTTSDQLKKSHNACLNLELMSIQKHSYLISSMSMSNLSHKRRILSSLEHMQIDQKLVVGDKSLGASSILFNDSVCIHTSRHLVSRSLVSIFNGFSVFLMNFQHF